MRELVRDLMKNLTEVLSGSTVLSYIADVCVSVSLIIVFLLLIRPLMKKLPRVCMYALWGMVLFRMLCPVTIHGIYGMLPESVEQMAVHGWNAEHAARDTAYRQRESYGGMTNDFRLPETMRQELPKTAEEPVVYASQEKSVNEQSSFTQHVCDASIANMGTLADCTESSQHEYKAGNVAEAGQVGTAVAGTAEKEKEIAAQSETVPESRVESGLSGKGMEMDAAAWLLAVWGIGVCLCLGYEFVSMFRTKWRFRDAKRIFANVYTHPLVYGSFVAGVMFPKIYVAEQMDGREWAYVIRHEQVHIRRRDYLVKPVAFSIFSLLWFNPLVWAAYHFMMRDMEVSCDESVIRNLPAGERKKYSYLLLSMAGGLDMPSQSPAFSAGEVKERILNVSKYKKPRRYVSVLAAVSVVLCSCGIVSAPEETVQSIPSPETKPMYVEQDMELLDAFSGKHNSKYYYMDHHKEWVLNPQGEFVCFRMMCTDPHGKGKVRDISCAEFVGSDGEYRTPTWLKAYKKRFPESAKYWLERYKYGADGYLYLYVAEYSMDRATYRYNYDERSNMSFFKRVKNYLLKVDEETGEMTEMPLPEQNEKEADGETAGDFIAGVPRLEFSVSSDGTLLLMSEGETTGELYDGASGDKLRDVTFENRASNVYSGDEFWVYASRNQVSKKLEVKVLDEDGEFLCSLPTEVEYDESRYLHMALGTKDNSILMVCGEGIYEAKLGEKEFRYIAGYKTDNIYYLWPDYYGKTVTSIYKGNEEDYYVGMTERLDEDDDGWVPGDKPDPWENELVFRYTQVEEENSSAPA